MKFLLVVLIFLNVFFFSKLLLAVETRSSVEFQWEEDPKAVEYEIQILNQEAKILKVLKSKSNQFKVKMPVNNYKIQGRIKTKLGNYSPWSKEADLLIPPNKVKIDGDKAEIKILNANPKTLILKTSIKWSVSPQAKKYLFKLKDGNGTILKEQEVNKPNFNLELSSGTYKYSITAISPNGVSSEEVESQATLQVKAATLEKPKFTKTLDPEGRPQIVFEKVPGILIRGELGYANFLSETWTPLQKYEDFKEAKWQAPASLKPGIYKFSFWATAKNASNSEKTFESFIVKPREEDLL